MDAPAVLQPLHRDLAALGEEWNGALPAFGVLSGGAHDELEQMGDAELLRVVDALARLRRDSDALLTAVAAEVTRRSGPELGTEGLAKKAGFHNPTGLLAAATGGSTAEAARLIRVGTATAPRAALPGERMPAKHPHLAAGLAAGTISLEAASLITSMLERVRLRADPVHASAIEKVLAGHASALPLSLLTRAIRHAEAALDPDGAPLADEQRWASRSVTTRVDAAGMWCADVRLDPVSAAPVKAVLDAMVSDSLRQPDRCIDHEANGPVIPDERTVPQRQADALVQIARHLLGCKDTLPTLAVTTIVARIDLADLKAGTGTGSIDGIDQPLSVQTLRQLAGDAEFLPIVFAGDSLPLDVGRAHRLFTKAQRIALAERDGGCASCGANVRYVEAHHIRWWTKHKGRTDLNNGVLLCPFCHHMMHRDDWSIEIRDGQVWFIPPPHIDPQRSPRLGGKARFALDLGAA